MHNTFLPADTFLNVLKHTPLVSIDLIVYNQSNEVLLGKRTNEPAKDSWFVPGGRIAKMEPMDEAFKRISRNELNVEFERSAATLKGVYEHIYDTNALGALDVTTHYVVLAHELFLKESIALENDAQHESLEWFSVEALMSMPDVHERTKDYFR